MTTGHRRHRVAAMVLLLALLAPLGALGQAASPQTALVNRSVSQEATPANAGPTWADDAVCYEVLVRSFADSDGDGIGDLNGLTQKLDYVNDDDPATTTDLGVTCLWLMPIFQATSYHGYDVEDFERVDPDYGTNEDFERLVAEAHWRGIRVILDLVLNHTSRNHPWFQEALNDPASPYRDWYIFSEEDPGYPGPWGAEAWHRSPVREEYYYGVFWGGMPDLNYRNPAVTAEAERISAFWLNEMGADGFRLDAIKHLIENGQEQENTAETHAWLRGYRSFLDATAPEAFTVGEVFGASPFLLAPYYPDQLHSYFGFEVGAQILNAANYGGASGLVSTVEDALDQLPEQRWAPFLTNHDQPRTMTVFNGDVGKAKLAATALLTMPGLPFVYYGEEIGMVGTKPDERIRTPMQWAAGPVNGFTTGDPWQPLQADAETVNVAAQAEDPASLLSHYRRLIQLHTAHPALAHGDFVPLETSESAVAAFLRQSEEETMLVLLNAGTEPAGAVSLSGTETGLAAGIYQMTSLLGATTTADLAVEADGSLPDQVLLPILAPLTGYVFQIQIKAGR